MKIVCVKNKIKVPIFNNRFIFGTIIVTIFAIFLAQLLYETPLLRYALLLVCVLFIAQKKDYLRFGDNN